MVDCHMHAVLDSINWKAALERHNPAVDMHFVRNMLSAYRDAGFTYLRDGGDRWGVGKAARALAEEHGIVYRTPLAPLCKAGHYGRFIGKTYENLREYTTLVRQTREDGADFIKIMISGLMDFDRFGVLTEEGLSTQEIRELIHIAHEEGMAVMAHANGGDTVTAAAQAGVDSVEHGAYLNEESLWAMYQAGTVWVPTLSTIGNLRGRGRFCESSVEAILESALANVQRFGHMGGLIAPGSDAGAWAVPHGCHTEYHLLSQALQGDCDAVLQAGTAVIMEKF